MWHDEVSTRIRLRSLIGEQLREVRYLFPADMARLPFGDSDRIHEVDHGVQLVSAGSMMITLMWDTDGECAALLAVDGSGNDAGITELVDSYDVSDAPSWRPMIGQAITSVGAAWHRSEGSCPMTPWAYRFEVGNHGGFVVALAETLDQTLKYVPNNVAVLFDRRDADSLHCQTENTSSWGVDI